MEPPSPLLVFGPIYLFICVFLKFELTLMDDVPWPK